MKKTLKKTLKDGTKIRVYDNIIVAVDPDCSRCKTHSCYSKFGCPIMHKYHGKKHGVKS